MSDATENQIKALNIINNHPEAINGLDFARIMWHDSKMMEQSTGRVWRNGNSYLFKLLKRGFVSKHDYKYPQFMITELGLKQLDHE